MKRPFPELAYATEAYAPNVPVAKKRLEPLGVRVTAIDDDDSLPFDDAGFDLVLNKHESFSPAEVRRILRPGGTFLTQQVGGPGLCGH
jgi:SAM-dependent methyltransferase